MSERIEGLTEKAARPGRLPDDPTPWPDTPHFSQAAPEDPVAAALAICAQVEANPAGWGGPPAVSLARSIARVLDSATTQP